ncbi:MAG TPA: ATP-binding protein [Kiritimatiellia bacterium]
MNLFQFSIFGALMIDVVVGVLVFVTQTRRIPNQLFFALSLVLAAWLTCMGCGATATDEVMLEFWIRQASASGALIPVAMNLLRLSIMYRQEGLLRILARARWWFAAYLPVAVLCQSRYFLLSARLPEGSETVGQPVYGPGFPLYAAYFAVILLLLGYKYVRDVRRSGGIQRTELQFILLACIAGLVFGVTFLLVPLLVGSLEVGQFLPLSVIILDGIMAYGIATRRIMDVPQILRRTTAYGLLTAYLTTLYAAVFFGANAVMHALALPDLPVPHLLATLAVAFSLAPATGRMQEFANRLFVNMQAVDVSETMQKANRILNSIATLDDLLDQFSGVVAHSVGTDRVVILLSENGHFRQRHPLHEDPLITISKTHPAAAILARDREPIVADVISRMRPTPMLLDSARLLQELQAAVMVGIHSKTGIEGVMLLGPRLSGQIYGSNEQRSLQLLCNHLAVALENAKLYTQVQEAMIYNDILLDNIVSGIVAAGPDRTVTVFNREAQRITRINGLDIISRPLDALPGPLAQALAITFETGSGPRDIELTMPTSDGELVPIRISGAMFHNVAGRPLGALLVINDLTAIKKLEKQVRRTDRLASLGTLSAGMAHEIKNPLVTLKTFTQLLPERYEDPDFRETFSSLVGQEVKRIDTLVNQLLRFAKPTKPSLAPAHVHEVLENTLRLVQQQLRQRGLRFSRSLNASKDLIRADTDLLTQAFINFLLNSIDAMEEHGELTVATDLIELESSGINLWGVPETESFIRISISDTGKGINPEDLPHVFDPFFTTKSTGTGLGLSVAHGIINEHGGQIDVESIAGRGTTFRISFPLLRKEAVA